MQLTLAAGRPLRGNRAAHTKPQHTLRTGSRAARDNRQDMTAAATPTAPRADEVQLSVVVPVYGCGGVPRRASRAADPERRRRSPTATSWCSSTIAAVDDGWAVLQRLARADGHVRALAPEPQLRSARRDHRRAVGGPRASWAVVMDCDLQEAPEDIPRLWAAAGEGYDVVRTIRRGRHHPRLKRWASRVYRRLTLETDTPPDYSTLSLISRRVIDAFLRLRDQDREYMIALDWLGFDSTTIEIDHAERHDGESAYTLRRLVSVALDGMFFRSTVLLRVVVLVGFVVALSASCWPAFEIVDYFARARPERARVHEPRRAAARAGRASSSSASASSGCTWAGSSSRSRTGRCS